jgi:hypothetical protein
MFESDQHEFDEEYEGYKHPAPPSPPPPAQAPATAPAQAPQSAPAAITAPAVQAPTVERPRKEAVEEEPEEKDPEELEYEENQEEEFVDPAQGPPPKKKKPNLLLIGGFAALVIFAVVAFSLARPKDNTPQAGDMGPGIKAADGLRGHLQAKWEGNAKTGRLVYQLHIEPMEDRWQEGFSHAVLNPPQPLSVNIWLLDSTGFALCGKEMDFHFDPEKVNIPTPTLAASDKKMTASERNAAIAAARQSEITQMQAQEVARERGKDIFQNQTGNDGLVSAVNVQGTLPCSPDQYRRADHWDFNTNFPTLQEQAFLLDPKGAIARGEFTPPPHPGKRTLSRLPQQGFVMQGDDRVTGYDSAHGTLWAENKAFQIDKRFGQATASAWASNYSLIHYRCDQHANCALTAAGEAAVLHARLNE